MRLPLILAFAALVVGAGPGWASGGGVVRDLTSTTAGECPSGKVMEHYFESGNVHGDAETIQVACLTSATKASWLWMAATECEGSKVCPRRRRPAAPFAYPAGHFIANRPDGQASPKTMTYNVKQAIRGEDCELKSYKTDNEDENYWSCASYKNLYDIDQLLTIVTTGPLKELDDNAEGGPKLPLQITAPASYYTVNEATPLIDVE